VKSRRDWWQLRHARRQYVFIVTYGRSGSTVLQNVLATIPGSHIMGENADALAGLFSSWRSAVQTRDQAGGTVRGASGDPWRGAHRVDPLRYNDELVRVFVSEILQPPRRAWLVGFKEVRYFDHDDDLSDYLDYIRMSFQPALLVINRRRGTDVAGSAWWKNHPDDIATAVARFDDLTAAYAALHPDDTLVLDYDEWASDAASLRPMFERLGVRFDLSVVEGVLAVPLSH
jgi:hypothetical protein